jgi:hypothetical protein
MILGMTREAESRRELDPRVPLQPSLSITVVLSEFDLPLLYVVNGWCAPYWYPQLFQLRHHSS